MIEHLSLERVGFASPRGHKQTRKVSESKVAENL